MMILVLVIFSITAFGAGFIWGRVWELRSHMKYIRGLRRIIKTIPPCDFGQEDEREAANGK